MDRPIKTAIGETGQGQDVIRQTDSLRRVAGTHAHTRHTQSDFIAITLSFNSD